MNYEEMWKELKEILEKRINSLLVLYDESKDIERQMKLWNKKEGLRIALDQIEALERIYKNF
jgi:hypothetical protein